MSPTRPDVWLSMASALLDTLPNDAWTKDMRARVPSSHLLEMWQLFVATRLGIRLPTGGIWGRHGHPRTGLSKARRAELWRDEAWRTWADKVIVIRVELKPGGRADSREREDDAVFTVEIHWVLDHGVPMVASVLIVPDFIGLAFNERIDLDAHMFACLIQLTKDAPKRARLPKRPRPGQARELGFYQQLLEEYEALVRGANPAPARTLAERRGINHSTLKSYLRRGRKYLQDEEE